MIYPPKIFSPLFLTFAIFLLDSTNADSIDIDRNENVKLIGGDNATKNEFPWLVNFLTSSNVFCGGAILNDRWILTAGHCANKLTNTTGITAGDYNLYSVDKEAEQIVYSEKIVVHENYARNRSGEMINDIALILLSTPLNFSAAIKAIDPPPTTLNTASCNLTFAGWGRRDLNENYYPLLQKVKLNRVSLTKCQISYSAVGMRAINDDMICTATSSTTSPCDGDEGSPLICQLNSTSYVCGIYSFGGPCYVHADLPSVHTKIQSYLSWIKGVMNNSSSLVRASTINTIFIIISVLSLYPLITIL